METEERERQLKQRFQDIRKAYAEDIRWLKAHGFREETDLEYGSIKWKTRGTAKWLEVEIIETTARRPGHWHCAVFLESQWYNRLDGTGATAQAAVEGAHAAMAGIFNRMINQLFKNTEEEKK